jgi:hypothetical protein
MSWAKTIRTFDVGKDAMSGNLLCLSLLNGQLKALAVHKGAVVGTWERPEPVEDFADFSAILKQAVTQTGYAGVNVALVLAHPRLTQQVVETPPVTGWNLKWFLERRVKQLKTFTTDAAWSYQPTLPTKNAKAVLVHLFPKPFLDQLIQGCEQTNLRLTSVFPATAIVDNQLTELPLEKDEIALLAAETRGTTTVIIGRKDGQIHLGRSLNSSWKVYPDRVNVDLNRTILYAKQQSGATVDSIWLFGDGAQAHVSLMQVAVKTPVKLSPIAPTPFYWNQQLLTLPADDTNNLISAEQQQAPRRQALFKVTALLIALLTFGALATAATVQVLVMDRVKQFRALLPKLEKLQMTKGQLQQRETDLLQKKEFVRIVSDEQLQPVAGWFLGYLGDLAPEELLLTHLQVKREDDLWLLQLGGTLQPTTNAAPATALSQAVAKLKDGLANGPFHVRILSDDGRPDKASAARQPGRGLAQAGQAAAGSSADEENQFFIEGVMR